MSARALEAGVLPAPGDALGVLRLAGGRITWRVVLATAAIAAALEVYTIYEFSVHAQMFPTNGVTPGGGGVAALRVYLSDAIINVIMAFAIMFATFVADELVERGAKRRVSYPCAVVAGSAVAALLQRQLHLWLHLPSRYDGGGVPHDVSMMEPAVVFFEYLIWGSIIVFIYVNRRTALQASARMNLAQVEQARARRRTLEARLQALQARVEPQFLFNTLDRVRVLYDDDREKGSRLLEDLIVYLRTALPHLRDSMSTLERELKLVTAYLGIMRVHVGDRLAFEIEAPQTPAARAATVPPMILLPLVDHFLIASRSDAEIAHQAVRVVARVDPSRLRVEVSASGESCAAERDQDVLVDIRERLRALYGDRGALAIESTDAGSGRVVMEIPYEPADGDHR
jgi:hypothetical protein